MFRLIPRFATAFLAVLALAAIPAEAAGFNAQLTGSAIEARSINTVEGPLAGLTRQQFDADAVLPPADFRLVGASIRLETSTAFKLYSRAIEAALPPEEGDGVHPNAIITGTAIRPGFYFDVYPTPGRPAPQLSISSSCSTLTSSMEEEAARFPWVAFRNATVLPIGGSVAWTTCHDAQATVSGDFTLYLWEVDARIESQGRTEGLHTGREILADGSPAGSMSRDTDAYLQVEAGTLTFTETSATTHGAFLDGATLASRGGLLVRDARGPIELPGLHTRLGGDTVSFAGDLSASLRSTGTGKPLDAGFQGRVESLAVAGTQVYAAPDRWPAWLWAAGAAAACAAIFAVGWSMRRATLARRTFLDAQAAGGLPKGLVEPANPREEAGVGHEILSLREGHYGRIGAMARHAHRAAALFPASLRARVLEGTARFKQGRHEDAWGILLPLWETLPEGQERANCACLLAKCAMGLNRPEDALEWLAKARQNHVETFDLHALDAVFDPLQEDDWFSAMRFKAIQRLAGRNAARDGPEPFDAAIA